MTRELTALALVYVGGDEPRASDLEAELAGASESVAVRRVAPPGDAAAFEGADCVVVAADDPGTDAVETVRAVRRVDPGVPIVLDGATDLSAVVRAGLVEDVADAVPPAEPIEGLAERALNAVTRVRERRALEGTRDRYRSLVEQSPAAVAIVDADAVIRFANEALASFLAVDSPADLVGRPVTEFTPSGLEDVTERRVERLFEAREAPPPREREVVDAEGETHHAIVASRPVQFEGDAAAQVVISDITEQKQLQTELREQRDRFSALFGNLDEPVVEVAFADDAPRIERVNPAFADLFGVDRGRVRGESLDDVIVPAEERAEAADLNRRCREGEPIEVEVTRETPQGPRDFLLRWAPYEADDAPTRGYAIYVDITERREWERQLRRQNERLAEVARVVSHDLRNPLNVAQGTVEALRDRADPADEEHFDRALRAHERMADIIEDMLALAKQGQFVSDLEPVAVGAVAREAWATVDTGEATLTVDAEGEVLADASRLQQAFENLFANAVEHAGADAAVRVCDLPAGFAVEDDGPGVPADERDAVFESGYSTDPDSTGFGLSIVKSIVEAHGWDVAVTESAAGGARFEVTGVERP